VTKIFLVLKKTIILLKGFQTTEEASSTPKRTSNTSKYEIYNLFSFLLFRVIFALQDSDPVRTQIRIQTLHESILKYAQQRQQEELGRINICSVQTLEK
jgi:hypothetical protein